MPTANKPLDTDTTGASVKFPPPLVFAILLGLGWLAHASYPISLSKDPDLSLFIDILGSLLVLLALALIYRIFCQFKRAETEIEPWKPTRKILDHGLYAYSRNPIYLALALASIGIGIIANSIWMATSFIPALWLVFYIAIKKEEVYLEEKFGQEYLTYKNRVRRWL